MSEAAGPQTTPEAQIQRPASRMRIARDRAVSLFIDPLKFLTQPIKLPGWATIVFGIVVFFPDWHARVDFWLHVAKELGGKMGISKIRWLMTISFTWWEMPRNSPLRHT